MKIAFIVVTIIAIVLLAFYIFRKIRRGSSCCGEHEALPRKINPKDNKLTNYNYIYNAGIEGMVCTNCLRHVENAFNACDGLLAKGVLETKTVRIYSKCELSRKDVVRMLEGTTYTITDFKEDTK